MKPIRKDSLLFLSQQHSRNQFVENTVKIEIDSTAYISQLCRVDKQCVEHGQLNTAGNNSPSETSKRKFQGNIHYDLCNN